MLKINLMRLICITIFSFLLGSNLWGQKTFASRALDYQWMFKRIIWLNVSNRYSAYIDTAVTQYNGKNYSTFIGDGLNFQLADSGTKVYVLKGSEEILLMDYSLNRGDTLKTGKYQMKILEKYKVRIENDSLWYIQMKSIMNQPTVLWLESIGCISMFHPINWYTYFGYADMGYNLDCVLHRDTSILKQFRKNCAIDNSLINSNKIWHTWASNHNGDLKFSVQYNFTNRDTILFGKKYRTMNQLSRYVRYDSLAGKYYILSNYNNGQELLVYFDRVKIGDTMAFYGTIADTVTKIEYKWVEDEYRKVITTGNDVYLSGIGTVHRVMWDNHLATFPEYASGNICYEETNTIRYHYPFFYQNKEQCEITSGIQNATLHSISIFPNPVRTILNFNTSDKKEYKIRNSLGVIVLEAECEGNINITALPLGIYFLELQSKNNSGFFRFQKE